MQRMDGTERICHNFDAILQEPKTTANVKLLRIAITFIFNGFLFRYANSKNRKRNTDNRNFRQTAERMVEEKSRKNQMCCMQCGL